MSENARPAGVGRYGPVGCPSCGGEIAQVHELDGHGIFIDVGPVPGGELVLRGDPRNVLPGEFVAAFHGVGPDGDDFFGIPAGAPRYRRHACAGRPR